MQHFDHPEYHVYTVTASLEPRYVHLTPDVISEAEYLHSYIHGNVDNSWNHIHRHSIADQLYLCVGDVGGADTAPKIRSPGYEGWETSRHEDLWGSQLSFNRMLFHSCSSPRGRAFDPDIDVDKLRRTLIKSEHVDEFDKQLEKYLRKSDRKT